MGPRADGGEASRELPFVVHVHCLEQAAVPGFIARLVHDYRLVVRGADPNYIVPETQLPVPGQVTVQAAQVSDPTEPPSSGPLLEIELLVTSERIDVSLGTAVINAYYYLEQARDAVAADPASTGLSPRFALRLQTDDVQEEGRVAPQLQLSLGVPVAAPPTRLASTRAYLRDGQPPLNTFSGEGEAPPVSKAAAPEGFYFDGLDSRVDWAKLRSSQINRIERSRDVKALLSFLPDLLYGDVTECVDEDEGWDAAGSESKARLLVKPLQLAQLSTQYLLFCEGMLKKQTATFKTALARKQKEVAAEQRELQNKDAMIARLRAEIKATDRLLRSYEDVHRACQPSCPLPEPVSALSPSRHAAEEEVRAVDEEKRRPMAQHTAPPPLVHEAQSRQGKEEEEAGDEEEEEDVVPFDFGSPMGSRTPSPIKRKKQPPAAEASLFDRHDTMQREELYQAIVTNRMAISEAVTAAGGAGEAGEGTQRRTPGAESEGGGFDDASHLVVEDLDL